MKKVDVDVTSAHSSMTWTNALRIMSGDCHEHEFNDHIDEAWKFVSDAIWRCLPEAGWGYLKGYSLYKWVCEGTYTGQETLPQLAEAYLSFLKEVYERG